MPERMTRAYDAALLLLLQQWRRIERPLEAGALGICTLLVCVEVFNEGLLGSSMPYLEGFLFFPLGIWAALRFGNRGAATRRLELLATAVRGLSEGVVISELTLKGPRVVFANEAFSAMVGLEPAELLGRAPRDLAGEMDPETCQRLDAALRAAEPFRGQALMKHRDGRRLPSEIQLSPVRDSEGVVRHLVCSYRDVTATQELRSRLLAAERVAAVGMLAAGVGHEIQNPLAYLELNLDAAERDLSRGEVRVQEALQHLQDAREGAERIRRILLPAASQKVVPAEPPQRKEEPAAAQGGSARRGRILIVDDEPRLAQSLRMLLEPTHDVVATTRGSEALELVFSGQRFDLVVCDLQMPGTTGMDVYARLREQAPELAQRLVFMSGGAYTPAARAFIRSVPNRVLEKPVRPDVLLAEVDALLAPGASPARS